MPTYGPAARIEHTTAKLGLAIAPFRMRDPCSRSDFLLITQAVVVLGRRNYYISGERRYRNVSFSHLLASEESGRG